MLWTPETRTRVGRLLQKRRKDQGPSQEAIAEKIDVSVGTVQAIEYNKYKVHPDSIERYAAAVGTTPEQLLRPESVVSPLRPVDPSYEGLNREHLAIARRYRDAIKAIRAAVEALLHDESAIPDLPESIADVVVALHTTADRTPQIAYWTLLLLERGDLLTRLAARLDRDPDFEERLRELIDNGRDPKGKPK